MMRQFKRFIKIILQSIFHKTGIPVKVGTDYWLKFHPRYFRWFTRSYEKQHLDQLRQMSHGTGLAIDIGAHFGLYSLILAKYCDKKVIAFEPTPYSAKIFQKNVRFNRLQNKIKIYEAAVGAKPGKASFLVQETDGAVSNSLVDYWHSDESKNKIEVEIVSVDSVINDWVDFMKIDAEGNELDVLMGAEKVISTNRPWILLALHPNAICQKGDNLKMIWDYISKRNYTVIFGTKTMTKEMFIEKNDLFDVILDPGK